MKKIIVLMLGVALIAGVTVLLVKPKEASKEAEQTKNKLEINAATDDKASSFMPNSKTSSNNRKTTKQDRSSDQQERLYTKEELDAAVSKAEVEMAERVLRDTVSQEEITETVDSVVDAFAGSISTPESDTTQATINNYIHDNGVYDKLVEKGIMFSGVECREAACKLEFEVNDTDDNLERRMPKMMSISQELSELETVRGKEAIITNDFEGRRLHYYYY